MSVGTGHSDLTVPRYSPLSRQPARALRLLHADQGAKRWKRKPRPNGQVPRGLQGLRSIRYLQHLRRTQALHVPGTCRMDRRKQWLKPKPSSFRQQPSSQWQLRDPIWTVWRKWVDRPDLLLFRHVPCEQCLVFAVPLSKSTSFLIGPSVVLVLSVAYFV